jgi:hypothetical protein
MATYVGGGGGDAVMREGLEIPTHDYISNTYTGNNLTETVFKRGGASGVVVATLTLTYDGSDNLLTVTRS